MSYELSVKNAEIYQQDKISNFSKEKSDSRMEIKMCATVLAKYVIEKWKLALPNMIEKNQKQRQINERY